MRLNAPFQISSRLLPALKVGSAWISIQFSGETSDGRARYEYFIDTPDFEHSARDLRSGVGGGALQEGMKSLLSFLTAAAECYRYNGNSYDPDPDSNCSLFPQNVVEWAYQNDSEISMLAYELREAGELLTD